MISSKVLKTTGILNKQKYTTQKHSKNDMYITIIRDSSGARLCVNAAPTCQKAHHFLPRVP